MARGRKAAAVDAGPVEGLWDLPDGWVWERLGNCGNWSSGGTPSAKNARYYGGTIPWLTSGELNDAVVSRSEKTITEEGYANSSVKWLPSNTLLVAMYGATIGKAAVTGFRCTTNQAVAACQPHPDYNVRYLLYYVLSQRDNLRNLGQGGAQPNISQALLKDYPCPVAPAVDQQKIAARIDALFAEIDEGEAALAEARAGVETYRKALLKAAVTGELTADWRAANPPQDTGEQLLARILADRRARWHADPKNARKKYTEPAAPDIDGLPELPDGWAWASLQQLGEFGRGKSKHRPRNDPKLYGGPYPFIQTGIVAESDGDITRFDQTYSETGLAQSKLWPAGTLCITIAANIAKTGVLTFDACFPDSIVGLTCADGVDPRYIELFIRTVREELDRWAPATAQKNINLETLYEVAVPLPSTAEQARIVEVAREETGLEATLEDAGLKALASTLRQSILAAAFRGELAA